MYGKTQRRLCGYCFNFNTKCKWRARFELYRSACAPWKIDKKFKINHPSTSATSCGYFDGYLAEITPKCNNYFLRVYILTDFSNLCCFFAWELLYKLTKNNPLKENMVQIRHGPGMVALFLVQTGPFALYKICLNFWTMVIWTRKARFRP
jgi:hypothetical protein